MNVNRDRLLIKDYLPTKFEASGAKRSWVIHCTRFERLTWPLTLTFDLLTWLSIGIIYSSRTIYLPSLKLQGQSVVEVSIVQGLEDWHDLWPWPLTYWPDHLLIKDYHSTYLAWSFCDKAFWVISCTRLRDTDRPTDIPTDMCNAICPLDWMIQSPVYLGYGGLDHSVYMPLLLRKGGHKNETKVQISVKTFFYNLYQKHFKTYHCHASSYLCPPLKKEGHIALHLSVGMSVCRSVGMSVSRNLVQLITQECFAQEASNLVGR